MDEKAYRALFFDLDGTLLLMDFDRFMGSYLKAIGAFVAKKGLPAEEFSQALNAGIKAMAAHNDGQTNAEAFWEAFFSIVDGEETDWIPMLDEFYETDFGKIGEGFTPAPAARQVIEVLRAKGYPLLLTTMPMFPLRAVEWRLEWADVDPSSFTRITHFENSTSVKPKLAYFAENLRAAGLEAGEVCMVGNNTKEDLACLELGMDAFLVTDNLLDPIGFDIETVRHGTLEELAAWAKALPVCANPASAVDSGRIEGAASRAAEYAATATDPKIPAQV